MKVRTPKLDFAEAAPHWSRHRPFAQIQNAGSTTLPYIEPYLNRVMALARDRLGADQARLREDIRLFVGQETNHYRLHRRFNERLGAAGYPGLEAAERALKADFARFLARRSLRFNTAYCAGFESLGIIFAAFMFEEADPYLKGADPAVADLWRWHLAEEYEHRSVCYDVHRVLFGGSVSGYLWRLWGLVYAMVHLGRYGKRVSTLLLAADRAGMSPDEQARSIAEERAFRRHQDRYLLPRVLRIFSPFYDPARMPAPKGAAAFLEAVEV